MIFTANINTNNHCCFFYLLNLLILCRIICRYLPYSAHLLTGRLAMTVYLGIYFCKIIYSLHFELYRKLVFTDYII